VRHLSAGHLLAVATFGSYLAVVASFTIHAAHGMPPVLDRRAAPMCVAYLALAS